MTGSTSLWTGAEDSTPEELLWRTQERFGPKAVFASSFGREDMVLLDMISRLRSDTGRGIRVVTLDTGRLFPETYDLIERARARYHLPVELIVPDSAEVERMVNERGPNLFYTSVTDRLRCCAIRKVLPLQRALAGSEAWIVGLRRGQSLERSLIPKVGEDPLHPGMLKVAPLAGWTAEDVTQYLEKHDVPVSELYARGYASIGCAPCTRAIRPGEDPRSGRWWWETGPKECGLHAVDPTTLEPPEPRGPLARIRSARYSGTETHRDVLVL